jgi:hypothetical protein
MFRKFGRVAVLGLVFAMSCVGLFRPTSASAATSYTYQQVNNYHSNLCMFYSGFQTACTGNSGQQVREMPGNSGYIMLSIAPAGGSQCLTVQGGSYANNAPLTPTPCNYASSQQFRKEPAPIGGGYYQLVAMHSGKCVTVRSESMVEGAQLVQYTCPSPGQVDWIGAGYWRNLASATYQRVRNWHSGLCLNGYPQVQNPCGDNAYLQWREIPTDAGFVQLYNASFGGCLAVLNASFTDNQPLTVGPCNGAYSAQFRKQAAPIGGGYYQLVVRHSAKCVTVLSESMLVGAQLVQYTCPSASQVDRIGAGYWQTF